MKNSSILERSLFLPFYLDNNSKNNTHILLETFRAEHFLFFLYICLKQANGTHWDIKEFYRFLSPETKVNLSILLNILLQVRSSYNEQS